MRDAACGLLSGCETFGEPQAATGNAAYAQYLARELREPCLRVSV